MLFLEREVGSEIIIGDDVVVKVASVFYATEGRPLPSALLGIDAPPDVPVDRMEVRAAKESGWRRGPRQFLRSETIGDEIRRLERRLGSLRAQAAAGARRGAVS